MLRSVQARGTWLQVKSLPNQPQRFSENLSVISAERGDGNKVLLSPSECWCRSPADPEEQVRSYQALGWLWLKT